MLILPLEDSMKCAECPGTIGTDALNKQRRCRPVWILVKVPEEPAKLAHPPATRRIRVISWALSVSRRLRAPQQLRQLSRFHRAYAAVSIRRPCSARRASA